MDLIREYIADGFQFSTDKRLLDINYLHSFLSTKSYWAEGIPLALVNNAINNSLCIGIFKEGRQIGFARIITDYTTFGYLADVFIDEAYRGKGLSKKLMQFILSFEEVKLFRRFILATKDAHGLYAQFGFKALKTPANFLEIHQPDLYKRINIPAR